MKAEKKRVLGGNVLRDGNVIGSMGHVQETIVKVLVAGQGRVKLAVIYPDICAVLLQ